MYKVYGDMLSGNCYKIKLLIQILGIEHEWTHVDILEGETHREAFTAMNPNGKIPVLEINEGQQYLWESNAILNFLAEGTSYLPSTPFERAKVLQWQFFEQYSHEPYIATARFINLFLGLSKEREAEYRSKQSGGHKALAVMEQHLAEHKYFVSDRPTIADITLYAYTHVAGDGGFDLGAYGQIQRWMRDLEALPGYITMTRDPA